MAQWALLHTCGGPSSIPATHVKVGGKPLHRILLLFPHACFGTCTVPTSHGYTHTHTLMNSNEFLYLEGQWIVRVEKSGFESHLCYVMTTGVVMYVQL